MELKRKLRKLAATAMALTMGLSIGVSAVGCNFEGQLKVEEFVANSTGMDTEYFVGETINFDGLILQAKYNDSNTKDIAVSEVMVKYNGNIVNNNLSVITETVGQKTIELIFEGKTVTITIVVTALPGSDDNTGEDNTGDDNTGEDNTGDDNTDDSPKYNVASFSLPQSVTARVNKMNSAGQAYGSAKYESSFYQATEKEVVVGDDNTYKFLPVLQTLGSWVTDDDYVEGALIASYKTNTTISIYQNDAYVALDKQEGETEISYSLGGVVYATEKVGKNEYDFTQDAVGAKLKLDVLPEACYVDPDDETPYDVPVSVEIKVVDAFNVYTAKQLAIIENIDNNWDSIKTELGITAEMVANVKGVVLQNDISILASDLPASFTYTIDREILYTDSTDPDNPITKSAQDWGLTNTFLKESDGFAYYGIYERSVTEGQSFTMYGNYYLIDYSKLPLVSSLGTADGNNFEDGYGSDYSNATLLRFTGKENSMGNVTIKDLDSKGNANRSQLLDAKENPVYAGGTIFMKMSYVNMEIDNVINKTSFTTFMPALTVSVALKNVKVFDAYQSAVYVWGGTMTINDSTMERSGGPLFILQHVERDNVKYLSSVTANAESILNNPVTGEEAWFATVGGTSTVASIKAMSQMFMPFGKALTDNGESGKLNLIALAMPEGSGAEVLTDSTAEGFFAYGEYVIDRTADATVNPLRQVYDMPVMEGVPGVPTLLQAGLPIFNTTYQPICYLDMNQAPQYLVNPADASFRDNKYITLSMSGLSIMLQFYNYGV